MPQYTSSSRHVAMDTQCDGDGERVAKELNDFILR